MATVNTCGYTDTYVDSRTGESHDYECTRTALDSGYCIYHDDDYFKDHTTEIEQFFRNELSNHKSTAPLFFNGCHLPEIKLTGLNFNFPVYFINAKFHGKVIFSNVYFVYVNFSVSKFFDNVSFLGIDVDTFFDFSDVRFDNYSLTVSISNSNFLGHSKFSRTFFPILRLDTCEFNDVNFRGSEFKNNSKISKNSFHSESDFTGWKIFSKTKLNFTSFDSNAIFQYNQFNAILQFHNVDFKEQRLVTFNGNLSKVSFLGTDITRIKFDEKIIWGENDRYSIFDARELIKSPHNHGLSSVLAVYRNLRENYEFRLMYEEAGQFFIKEMDLRKNYYEDSNDSYQTKLKPICKRLISLTSFYSYLCRYGENFSRPFIWSCLIIGLASVYFWINPDLHSIRENYSLTSTMEAEELIKDPFIYVKITLERTLSAFFQIASNDLSDYIVRIVSIPVLGTLFIVLRRRFERRFRH